MLPRLADSGSGAGPARLPTPWAAGLALLGGVLGVLAFPPLGWWPAALLSVALLSVAVDGRRSRTGAWLGLIYGGAFFVALLHWTGVFVGAAPWLLLAGAEAAFCAGLGALLSRVQRLPVPAVWVSACWVLQEAVRDRAPFGGFPWGRLAFSQADGPLRWFAAVGGAPLVTCAVAVGGGALAVGARHLRPWHWRGVAAGSATALAVPAMGLALGHAVHPGPGRTTTVALIQGSVPDLGLSFEQRSRQVLDNHLAQTMQLAGDIRAGRVPRPSLVVWPENASDVDPLTDRSAARDLDAAAHAVGAPLLVGAILQGPGAGHRRNAGILWSPTDGPGAEYVKRHPVPFGEYIPLRSLARIVSSDVDLVTQDMVAGHGDGLLRGAAYPIGDVICFEVAYDDLVRSSVNAGAQLLVVQTNNATFGHTAETFQQLAMSQLRAVEHGRTVLQVATTGKSAVIAPNGRVRVQSGALFTPARLVEAVPLRTTRTIATRLGAGPEYVVSLLAVLAVLWGLQPRRRHPVPHPAAPTEEMVIA